MEHTPRRERSEKRTNTKPLRNKSELATDLIRNRSQSMRNRHRVQTVRQQKRRTERSAFHKNLHNTTRKNRSEERSDGRTILSSPLLFSFLLFSFLLFFSFRLFSAWRRQQHRLKPNNAFSFSFAAFPSSFSPLSLFPSFYFFLFLFISVHFSIAAESSSKEQAARVPGRGEATTRATRLSGWRSVLFPSSLLPLAAPRARVPPSPAQPGEDETNEQTKRTERTEAHTGQREEAGSSRQPSRTGRTAEAD